MSVQAIAWVLEHSQAKGTARCVMVSIANHLGPDGSGWVHVRRVCAEAACSVQSYRRAVQEAEQAGELRRLPFEGGGARLHDRHRPNLFVFPALHDATNHPQETSEAVTTPSNGQSEDVTAVFGAWVEATGRDGNRTKLTKQRRERITARLGEGYTVGDLVDAVRGVTLSGWHMGENDNRQRYDDIPTVLRDGAQVEKFRDLWVGKEAATVSHHPALRPKRGCDRCDNGFIEVDGGDVVVCNHCAGGSGDGVFRVRRQVEAGT